MSADPIIYCLEQLTDYRQFERLCSDLMSDHGYSGIEPIGGSGDRGRDALFVDPTDPDKLTIFAFSVEATWQRKVKRDCARIHEEKHGPTSVVFVCTSTVSSGQRDEIKSWVLDQYGWDFEMFDLERLRVMLVGDSRHLLAKHPAIFCPPWFPVRGGLPISESADTLVIDHDEADHAVATWLSRRLSLAGYRTWCYGTAPLAGEDADSSIRALVQNRGSQYLPILSGRAIANSDLMGRCGAACEREEFVVPCWTESISRSELSSRLAQIEPARFDDNWSRGMRDVLNSLEAKGIGPELEEEQGRTIALRAYVPEVVTRPTPEQVVANVFAASVPKSILICDLSRELRNEEVDSLRKEWAFAIASSTTLLAFEEPPASVPLASTSALPEFAWESISHREGKRSTDVVKELIRRSLVVACLRVGFEWCDDRKVVYYPQKKGPQNFVSFNHLDGRNTRVSLTGEKQYSWGANATRFRYQLGPHFRASVDPDGAWWVTMRIYVRVTELDGTPLQKKEIVRKRKAVTKGWWNREWLARTLAVMQYIGQGGEFVTVGAGRRGASISTSPLEWQCPVSIDGEVVDRIGDFQKEMATLAYSEEDEASIGEPDNEVQEGG